MLLLHHVNFLEAQPRTGFCSNNTRVLYRIDVFHTIAYSIIRSKRHRQNKIVDAFSMGCYKCTLCVTVHVAVILRSVFAVNEGNSNFMPLHSVLPAVLLPADPDRMWV